MTNKYVYSPSHEWGDEWFQQYEDQLYAAERYINKFFYKVTKKSLLTKEKYGTIRYECLNTSLKTNIDIIRFLEIIVRATKKFPEVAPEIVDDLLWTIDVYDATSMTWYLGYFQAILDRGLIDEEKRIKPKND